MTEVDPKPVRRGAVAVIVREARLLVVRRSRHVAAPRMFCFPGGGIEPGETEADAVRREIREELNVAVEPVRKLWHSLTPWNVDLAWWLAELDPQAELSPHAHEVESAHWLTVEEILALDDLLESNRQFFAALECGQFHIESL